MKIEEIRELKIKTEKEILMSCLTFEDLTNESIKDVSIITIGSRLFPGMTEEEYEDYKPIKDKITSIELTIQI